MRVAPALVLATLFVTTHFPSAPLSSGNAAAVTRASMAANILIVKSHTEIANWVMLDPAKRGENSGRMRLVTRGAKIYLPLVATFSNPSWILRLMSRIQTETTAYAPAFGAETRP